MQIKQKKPQQRQRRQQQIREPTENQILSGISSQQLRQKIRIFLFALRSGNLPEPQVDLAFMELTTCQDFAKIRIHKLKLQCNNIKSLENLKVPPCLMYLTLGSNMIESIQILQNLEFPELRIFKVYGNKITKIKSLRKCLWPKIEQINLEDNPINDMPMITTFPKNWKNQIKTQILVCNPYNKLFEKQIARIIPKCHQTKLKIILNFQ